MKKFLKEHQISFPTVLEIISRCHNQIQEINLSRVKSIKNMGISTEKIDISSNKNALVLTFYGRSSDKKIRFLLNADRAGILFRKENDAGNDILWKCESPCLTLRFQSYIGDLLESYQIKKEQKGRILATITLLAEIKALWDLFLIFWDWLVNNTETSILLLGIIVFSQYKKYLSKTVRRFKNEE